MTPRSLSLIAALVFSFSLSAQSTRNELGASIGYADMPGFGDAGTFSLTYNRFWTGNLSSQLGLTSYAADLHVVDGPSAGELQMGALTGEVQYHFWRDRRLSPYVGGGVAFVTSQLADTPAGDIEADNEITGVASAGVNLNLGRRWAINGDVTYMPYDADFPPVATIDMDPLTISAGVRFRW
ncbi:MAG TPA: OmpW family outer membrane protein [Thermoanaerobaculia bacterium]